MRFYLASKSCYKNDCIFYSLQTQMILDLNRFVFLKILAKKCVRKRNKKKARIL